MTFIYILPLNKQFFLLAPRSITMDTVEVCKNMKGMTTIPWRDKKWNVYYAILKNQLCLDPSN